MRKYAILGSRLYYKWGDYDREQSSDKLWQKTYYLEISPYLLEFSVRSLKGTWRTDLPVTKSE